MISAFGVVHKSYGKIRPKLGRAIMYDRKVADHVTLDEKLRRHANQSRQAAGSIGRTLERFTPEKREAFLAGESGLKYRQEHKRAAHGMYAAISRNNKRFKGPERLP